MDDNITPHKEKVKDTDKEDLLNYFNSNGINSRNLDSIKYKNTQIQCKLDSYISSIKSKNKNFLSSKNKKIFSFSLKNKKPKFFNEYLTNEIIKNLTKINVVKNERNKKYNNYENNIDKIIDENIKKFRQQSKTRNRYQNINFSRNYLDNIFNKKSFTTLNNKESNNRVNRIPISFNSGNSNINIISNNRNHLNNNRLIPFAYNIDNAFEISKNNYRRENKLGEEKERKKEIKKPPENTNDIKDIISKIQNEEDCKFEKNFQEYLLKDRRNDHSNLFNSDISYINDSQYSIPLFDIISNYEEEVDDEIEDDYDNYRQPLDEEIIDSLPIVKIKDINKLDEDKCIICMENFKENDDTISLPCIHIFHSECIKKWLQIQDYCPICKFVIVPFNSDELN